MTGCMMCGDCCRYLSYIIPVDEPGQDWIRLHGATIEVWGDGLLVKVPAVCDALVDNRCMIYETRPEVCRRYRCNKSIENEAMEEGEA